MSALSPRAAAVRVRPRRRATLVAAAVERRVGAALVLGLCAAFVVVPEVSAYRPADFVDLPNLPPSGRHLFGTDALGRDLLTRAFAGGRNDLLIVALAVSLSLAIGTSVGILVGLTRSRLISETVLRVIDAVLAIPFVILVLSLIIVLGGTSRVLGLPPGVGTVVAAIVMVNWAVYARLARAQTLGLRDREFVVAARLLGYSRRRVVLRHVAPNVLATTLSYAATDAVLVIIGTASLAFLGSGIQEPTPELGNIMFQGHSYLATTWWVTILPGLLVLLLGIALALIADSYNDD